MYTVPQCAGIIWLIIKLQCVALRSVCSAAAAFWVGKKPLTLRYAKHTSDCTNRWIFKMSKTKSLRTKKCTERKPAIYKVCTWLGIAETYLFLHLRHCTKSAVARKVAQTPQLCIAYNKKVLQNSQYRHKYQGENEWRIQCPKNNLLQMQQYISGFCAIYCWYLTWHSLHRWLAWFIRGD